MYRSATWYAKVRSEIVNGKIVSQLRILIEKLGNTTHRKLMNKGIEIVKGILTNLEKNRVFKWAPKNKGWLKDLSYVFWLGSSSQPPYSNWNK